MKRAAGDDALAFTPRRLAILLPLALVLWALAWSAIRFRGPHGAFDGVRGVVTYLGVIPATAVINWLHLKLASLPRQEIVNAVAITLATATTLDGTLFWFFPQVYGNDPEVLRHGAAFIIWAGAVAFSLAFVTRLSVRRGRETDPPDTP
jgi:hypothetical protein